MDHVTTKQVLQDSIDGHLKIARIIGDQIKQMYPKTKAEQDQEKEEMKALLEEKESAKI
jgi:hypothetical protein